MTEPPYMCTGGGVQDCRWASLGLELFGGGVAALGSRGAGEGEAIGVVVSVCSLRGVQSHLWVHRRGWTPVAG